MATSTDIVNQALSLMGGNVPLVTGSAPTFDSSTAGKAAAQLYAPTVATIMRQKGWDFAHKSAAFTTSGNTPPGPFTTEYLYPADAIQVLQVMPPSPDPFNPKPVNFQEALATVGGVPVKVIRTNQAGAIAIYTAMPPESTWDSLFREAVVRLLASNFAMAVAGKPDAMTALQESGAAFEQIGEGKDN